MLLASLMMSWGEITGAAFLEIITVRDTSPNGLYANAKTSCSLHRRAEKPTFGIAGTANNPDYLQNQSVLDRNALAGLAMTNLISVSLRNIKSAVDGKKIQQVIGAVRKNKG